MKTLIAKYFGTCRACGQAINKGETITFFGKGHTEHLDCANEHGVRQDEDAAAGLEQGTLDSDRRLARQGLSVIRLSSGHVITQNRKGRCEDAPCCGCCT